MVYGANALLLLGKSNGLVGQYSVFFLQSYWYLGQTLW